MITLESIIKSDAEFARNLGAAVEIDSHPPAVAIEWFGRDGGGYSAFLLPVEAARFLALRAKLSAAAPDVPREDIELHLARPYLECL